MPNLMRNCAFFLFVFLCLCLSGCGNSRELDDMSYVLTIGVDLSDEPDKYVFTYRIAMPKVFLGEGGGEDKDKTKLVSVKSVSLSESVKELSIAMNRQIELSHASALFIHEDAARRGVYPFVSTIVRSPIYRNSLSIMVTKQEARTVLEKNTAPFELFQYRWVDSMERAQDFAASYSIQDIKGFSANMSAPTKAVLTGIGGINEKTLNKFAAPPLAKHSVPQYTPATVPRDGGTELLVAGSAVFSDWRMIGSLTSSEALGALLLEKNIETVLTVPDPVRRDFDACVGIKTTKPKFQVNVIDGKMRIGISMIAECQLQEDASGIDYQQKKYAKQLERQIAEALSENIYAYFAATKPLGADCLRIADYYRPQCATYDEWAAIDWAELYHGADVSVDVQVEMKRTGLLGRYTEEGEAG